MTAGGFLKSPFDLRKRRCNAAQFSPCCVFQYGAVGSTKLSSTDSMDSSLLSTSTSPPTTLSSSDVTALSSSDTVFVLESEDSELLDERDILSLSAKTNPLGNWPIL